MKTWFDKKFNTTEWWETRLKNVAKSLGLEISWASCYFAHLTAGRHLNWRCVGGWLKHLDYATNHPGFDF